MFIVVNGILKNKIETNESNLDLNDFSKHQTFEVGFNNETKSDLFKGFMKDMRIWFKEFDWKQKYNDPNY